MNFSKILSGKLMLACKYIYFLKFDVDIDHLVLDLKCWQLLALDREHSMHIIEPVRSISKKL